MELKNLDHNIITNLTEGLVNKGISLDDIKREFKLDFSQLNNADSSAHAKLYIKIFNWSVLRCQDDFLGLYIGENYIFKGAGLYNYLLDNSANIEELCESLAKYSVIFCDTFGIKFIKGARYSRLYYKAFFVSPTQARQDIDFGMAVMVKYFRNILFSSWAPNQTCFAYDEPHHSQQLQRVFGQRISFNQSANFIEFDNEILALKNNTADPELFKVLKALAEQLIESLDQQDDIVSKVKFFLTQNIGSKSITAEHIASELNMSNSSLSRRLREQSTSFKKLKDGVILDLAKKALMETSIPISDIAQTLGFSEHSAFIHAFKRMEGIAPSVYRTKFRKAVTAD